MSGSSSSSRDEQPPGSAPLEGAPLEGAGGLEVGRDGGPNGTGVAVQASIERLAVRDAPVRVAPAPAGVSRSFATAGGLAAALAAGLTMVLMRSTLAVRSAPERLLEWMLLFVPLDLFEAGIQRFGFDAKRYGLYAAIVAMLLVLALLGAVALRRRWSSVVLAGLGLGLWLMVMVVVMPLTSAGVFASGLVNGTREAIGGYLVVALVYAGVLLLFRERRDAIDAAPEGRRGVVGTRRPSILLAGGALLTYGATYAAVRWGPRQRLPGVLVLDPQEPMPSGGIDPPRSHPSLTGALPPRGQSTAVAGPLDPPPPVSIPRDKDGALLPSGRKPGELAAAITSNADFYVVTKNAAGDPVLDVASWRLRIDGEVQRAVEVDYDSLRRLPAVEVTKTLECISNFVAKCELVPFGCDLISTARWKGIRVSDVLGLAGGVKPGAISLATFAADEFTTALPIELALGPETLLVYEMNGQVLPREHGYPMRMLVPGRYGMKNAKWVVALRAMNREFTDWYGQRNWSRTGIVKTMSRIDAPAPGATLEAGVQRVAGVAYAGDRGVAYVEFSADGGASWTVADILEQPSGRDAWVRWQGEFFVQPGAEIILVARATDGTGVTQPQPFVLPQPDGGSGWCAIVVNGARS